jgi:hypothetical protein
MDWRSKRLAARLLNKGPHRMPRKDPPEVTELFCQITEFLPVEKLRGPHNEVYRLCEALSEVVDPDSLGGWFAAPNDAFDGLKPIEMIERGEIDRLWEMVFRLRSGMPG